LIHYLKKSKYVYDRLAMDEIINFLSVEDKKYHRCLIAIQVPRPLQYDRYLSATVQYSGGQYRKNY